MRQAGHGETMGRVGQQVQTLAFFHQFTGERHGDAAGKLAGWRVPVPLRSN
jgi:hypothetical protein